MFKTPKSNKKKKSKDSVSVTSDSESDDLHYLKVDIHQVDNVEKLAVTRNAHVYCLLQVSGMERRTAILECKDMDTLHVDEFFYIPCDAFSTEKLEVEVDVWQYARAKADRLLGSVVLRIDAALAWRTCCEGRPPSAHAYSLMIADEDDVSETGATLTVQATVVSSEEAKANPSTFERRASDPKGSGATSLHKLPVVRAVFKDLNLSPRSTSKGSNVVKAKSLPKRYYALYEKHFGDIATKPHEKLLDAIHCSLRTDKKKMSLVAGKLLITRSFLLFFSRVVSKVTCHRIALTDTTEIRRAKAKVRGITITTTGVHARVYHFAGFVQPEVTLDQLTLLWRTSQSRKSARSASERSSASATPTPSPTPSSRHRGDAGSDDEDNNSKHTKHKKQQRDEFDADTEVRSIEEQRRRLSRPVPVVSTVVTPPPMSSGIEDDARTNSTDDSSEHDISVDDGKESISSSDSHSNKSRVDDNNSVEQSSESASPPSDLAANNLNVGMPPRSAENSFRNRAHRKRSQLSVALFSDEDRQNISKDDGDDNIQALRRASPAVHEQLPPEQSAQIVFKNLSTGEVLSFDDVEVRMNEKSGVIEDNTPLATRTWRRWRKRWQ